MVSVDFFTVPTIRFQVLCVPGAGARPAVHSAFGVTAGPTAEWQLREAFP